MGFDEQGLSQSWKVQGLNSTANTIGDLLWLFRFKLCHPFRFISARHFGLNHAIIFGSICAKCSGAESKKPEAGLKNRTQV